MARPTDQALAVPATPASAVDGPSGFDPSRGISGFLNALRDASPNGEPVLVQYHPNGDWSVLNGPAADPLQNTARILDAHRADLAAEAVTVSFGSRGPNQSACLDHYTVEIKVGEAVYSASAKYPADAAALAKQKAKDAAEAKKRKAERKAAAKARGEQVTS